MARTPRNKLTIRTTEGRNLLFGYHRGKRVRVWGDLADLVGKKRDLELELEVVDRPSTRLVRTWLSEDQVQDAEAAVRLAGGRSLLECVRKAPESRGDQNTLLKPALTAFFSEIERLGRRGRTLGDLQTRLGAFLVDTGLATEKPRPIKKHVLRWAPDGGAKLSEALGAAVGWVHRAGVSDRTKINDSTVLNRFFGYCKKKGWVDRLPEIDRKDFRPAASDPRILTPSECRTLIEKCVGEYQGLLAYCLLGLWGFVRPRELQRLTWDVVDLSPPRIRIGREMSKTRQFRVVGLPPEFAQLLEPLRDKPICPPKFRTLFDGLRESAGLLRTWQPDILRHTGISYHYAQTKDLKETCRNAGNSTDVLFRHYLALATEETASEFYALPLVFLAARSAA